MKKMSSIAVVLLLVACASTPAPKSDASQQTNDKNTTPSSSADTAQISKAEAESAKLAAELQELQIQSVYFEFDKFNVKHEFADTVKKQAEFIKNHKGDVVTLEGNTDERGSSEYNFALGSKRANAVKNNLKILGIPVDQIKDASFGEEKPRLACHDESCWKENRRVDFVHQLKH